MQVGVAFGKIRQSLVTVTCASGLAGLNEPLGARYKLALLPRPYLPALPRLFLRAPRFIHCVYIVIMT